MSDLEDLYQELILDHNKSPRNYRRLAEADRRADGYNPLCGDRVTVFLKVEDDLVIDASFEGSGEGRGRCSGRLRSCHQVFPGSRDIR